ncbi:hypothetical protein SDC9_64371 [bioreactor metagenome]|uniref:Flavodoxin domain-containing protein n=1 Tax=bioreactor metagenome TaxID=1076179 RepID=A0A644XQC6_9ZZZZ
MKTLVICPKKSGNTHHVCQYVCSSSGAELMALGGAAGPDLGGFDIIIFASGIYAGRLHKNILEFAKNIQPAALKPGVKIYMFMTWFGRGGSDQMAMTELRKTLDEKGLTLEENYMTCFGKGMGVVRMSHPNDADCKNVLAWVKELSN